MPLKSAKPRPVVVCDIHPSKSCPVAALACNGAYPTDTSPGASTTQHLRFFPGFQIQVSPKPRITLDALVMLRSDRIQMPERLQPWHIRQGLGGVHVSLKHVPQRHYLFFRRLDPAQGGLAELFGGIAMHEHQAVEDTAGFYHSLNIGIELPKGRRQFLAARHCKAHFTGFTIEVAFSGFEASVQELTEEFVKGSE